MEKIPKINQTIEAKIVSDTESSENRINPVLKEKIDWAKANNGQYLTRLMADGSNVNVNADKNINRTNLPSTKNINQNNQPSTVISIKNQPTKNKGEKLNLLNVVGLWNYINDTEKFAEKEKETRINSLTNILDEIVGTNNELLTEELGKILLKVHLNTDIKHTLDNKLSAEHKKLLEELAKNLASADPDTGKLLTAALDQLGWENPSNDPYNIARYIGLNGSKSMFIAQQDEHKVRPNKLAQIISYWNNKDESDIVEQKNIFKNAAKKLEEENVGVATKQDYIGKQINGLYALLHDSEGNILCFNKEGIYKVYNFDELSLGDTPKIEKPKPLAIVDEISGLGDSEEDVIKPEPSISLKIESTKEENISKLNNSILELFKNRDVKPGRNVTLLRSIKEEIEKSALDANFAEDLEVTKNLSSYYKEVFNSVISGDISIDYRNEKLLSLQDKLIQNYNEYIIKAEQEKIKADYTKQFKEVFGKVNLELDQKFIQEGIEKLNNPEEAEAYIYKTLTEQIVSQYEGFKQGLFFEYENEYRRKIGKQITEKNDAKITEFKLSVRDRYETSNPTLDDSKWEKLLASHEPLKKEIKEFEISLYEKESKELGNIEIPARDSIEEIDFENYANKLGITNTSILEVLQPLVVGSKEGDTGVIGYEDIYLAELTKQLQQAYPLQAKEEPKKIEVEELREDVGKEIDKPKGEISQESMEATETKLENILNKIGFKFNRNKKDFLEGYISGSGEDIYLLPKDKQEAAILDEIAKIIIHERNKNQPENFRNQFTFENIHDELNLIFSESPIVSASGIITEHKENIIKVLEKALNGESLNAEKLIEDITKNWTYDVVNKSNRMTRDQIIEVCQKIFNDDTIKTAEEKKVVLEKYLLSCVTQDIINYKKDKLANNFTAYIIFCKPDHDPKKRPIVPSNWVELYNVIDNNLGNTYYESLRKFIEKPKVV